MPRVKQVYGRFKATAKAAVSVVRGWPSPTTGKAGKATSGPPQPRQAAKGQRLRDTILSLKRKDEV